MKVCSVDGCEKAYRARGLCATHYNQQHQPERHKKVTVPCTHCGEPCSKAKSFRKGYRPFCDYMCRDLHRMEYPSACDGVGSRGGVKGEPLPPDHPVRLLMLEASKSDLRRAVESGDSALILSAIRALTVEVDGCWVWQRRAKDGYAQTVINKRTVAVHRLSLEAHLGKPLGSQAAHHRCSNTLCVNPLHLQPVTHRENLAEMLTRKALTDRIRELEAALVDLDPQHPLLHLAAIA